MFKLLLKMAVLPLLAAGTAPALAATAYPLTVNNCGQQVTFKKAPEKIVSIGQGMTEVLLSLGLSDKIAGTAVWFGPVLPEYAQAVSKIDRLADNDPSFESVVGKEPDLVAAEYEWHVGPQGIVGRRDQFAALGIDTYIAPTDCVAKNNSTGGDGTRDELFTTDLLYREITELADIFDVGERGVQLIAELKAREAKAVASVAGIRGKNLPVLFWFSSKEVTGDAFIAGKTGAPAYMLDVIGARNVVDTREEWPMVGWETIASANPAVIVIATMDRRRFPADDPTVKLDFLAHDPIASKLDAVKKRHIVLMDAKSMNPSIRTVDGIEVLADGIRSFGLTQ